MAITMNKIILHANNANILGSFFVLNKRIISETCSGGFVEDCDSCRASKNRTWNSK